MEGKFLIIAEAGEGSSAQSPAVDPVFRGKTLLFPPVDTKRNNETNVHVRENDLGGTKRFKKSHGYVKNQHPDHRSALEALFLTATH